MEEVVDGYHNVIVDTWDMIKTAGIDWKLTNGAVIEPGLEDVKRVLDKARDTLYDSESNQIEVAGLLIRSNGKDLDVYVKAGTLKGES